MNTQLEEKVKEVHTILLEKVYEVYDIFKDFFGEEFVDLQGCCSLEEVRYKIYNDNFRNYIPKKNITNELSEKLSKCPIESNLSELDDTTLEELLPYINSRNIVQIIRSLFSCPYILILFPHVRITNEFGRFTDINYLFVKVKICYDGSINGRFGLNRSKYSYLHISENYMHSHVSDIPFSNFENFQLPCLGRGPINNTISSLSREFNADLWNLFCLEVSKYVQVESIDGVPYHHLEHLGKSRSVEGLSDFNLINYHCMSDINKTMIKDFLEYFIPLKKLKFNYRNHSYALGMSFIEYIMIISNEFIKWYNDKSRPNRYEYPLSYLQYHNIISKCIISKGKIYYDSNNRNTDKYKEYVGKHVCTFKGKDYNVEITGLDDNETIEYSYILNVNIALYVLSIILKVLNFRYEKERYYTSDSTCEKARYF